MRRLTKQQTPFLLNTHSHAQIYANTHIYIYTIIHTHIHQHCRHTCTLTYIHIDKRIHMHTHKVYVHFQVLLHLLIALHVVGIYSSTSIFNRIAFISLQPYSQYKLQIYFIIYTGSELIPSTISCLQCNLVTRVF